MSEFRQLIITNKGQALMAKLIAGTANVTFTKVAASSTTYSDSQIPGLTGLSNIKQQVAVSKVTKINSVAVQVDAAMENSALTTGYYMNSLGLYAKDPDEGEILYAVAGANVGAYMPPYNGITVSGAYLKLVTTVSNASNVSMTVDPAAVATVGDINALQAEITDIQSFIGYTDADIYGVEVDFKNKKFTRLAGAVGKTPGDAFDGVKAFGGRRRCNVTDDGKVVAYYGDAGFSETGVLTSAITIGENTYPTGTKVQVMVEQPKFYYKVVPLELEKIQGGKGFHMRKARYYVSDTMKAGFKLHPAFIKDGKEKNFIYLSAYEGCTYDTSASAYKLNDAQDVDWTNDVLASIANAKPTSGLTQSGATRNGFRTIAAKRGSGWSQQTIQSVAATQILFLVEYASFNIQEKLGAGVTTKTDDGATSMTEITGATTTLGNKSGQVINTNGYSVVAYRGEENPFGNLWKWVDGINVNNGTTFAEGDTGTIYVADHDFADNTDKEPYTEIGFSSVYLAWSYISAFGYSEDGDWLFFPTEGKGNSSLPVGDCGQVINPGWRVAVFGASWRNASSNAGLFYLGVTDDSAARIRSVGGRLLYVPDGTDAPAA
jgi:hypothetical protein